jgi:hypothetical protein
VENIQDFELKEENDTLEDILEGIPTWIQKTKTVANCLFKGNQYYKQFDTEDLDDDTLFDSLNRRENENFLSSKFSLLKSS